MAIERRRIGKGLLAAGAALCAPALARGQAAAPETPAVLRRGLNITNWFRFPASLDPAALRAHVPDATLDGIRAAGFTFIRLCIQPQILLRAGGGLDGDRLAVVLDAVARIRRAGLAVIVDAHPESWRPEEREADRQGLFDFWRGMAPHLARHDPAAVFVEIMNEPVFDDHAKWHALQAEVLREIRGVLPGHLVIAQGADWGSIDGLLRLPPLGDPRVLYSVHDYTPGVFAHLASWEQGHDRDALARLPFPVADRAACRAVAARTGHARTRDLGAWYCQEGWDAARVRGNLARAAAWGRRAGAPVLLLEFGAHAALNAPARAAYIEAVRRGAEAEGMGWALWGLGDIMGFPSRPGPQSAPADPGLLRALGLAA
ncbi:glycoside hydrolase family 5 protein [Falsiroseomonas sp. CW058]|uniref:glycoside hydrolase family 5 protein n=1 Tax=Falsiroseomonas sp. CW058 TaxID=3388664 RepID=UPI003D31D869